MNLLRRRRRHDPLEWRGDRLNRHDLWAIFDFDVDRANVALATFEAQQRGPELPIDTSTDDRPGDGRP